MNHELLKLADAHSGQIVPECTREELIEAMEYVKALKEATAVVAAKMEEAAIAWIAQNGEIEVGEVRYYVGPNKSTKCRDLRLAAESVLNATCGDIDALVKCLSTSAFKHGTCREVLTPEVWDGCFEVVETPDLKEGKPKKRLQRVDGRFIKDGKPATDGPSVFEGAAP